MMIDAFSEIEKIICDGEITTPAVLQQNKKCQDRESVFCRQLVFYFMRKHTRESLYEIGSYYGKDHATVYSSIKTIQNYIDTDKVQCEKIDRYATKIRIALEGKRSDQDGVLIKLRYKLIENITFGKPLSDALLCQYHEALRKESKYNE